MNTTSTAPSREHSPSVKYPSDAKADKNEKIKNIKNSTCIDSTLVM